METVFTKILDGSIPGVKIYEDDKVFAFMDSGQVNSSRSHRTQPHRTNLVGLVRISIVERKLS